MKREISMTLRYFAKIREITGKREETVVLHEGNSVMDALSKLSEIYGEKFSQYIFDKKKPKEDLTFLVNGQAINNFNKKMLKEGDVLAILPPISGG